MRGLWCFLSSCVLRRLIKQRFDITRWQIYLYIYRERERKREKEKERREKLVCNFVRKLTCTSAFYASRITVVLSHRRNYRHELQKMMVFPFAEFAYELVPASCSPHQLLLIACKVKRFPSARCPARIMILN